MNSITPILILVFITSFALAKLILAFSLNRKLFDIPNERSSHSVATPYGGGISIVIVFLSTIAFNGTLTPNIIYAIIGAGILVSVIGLWDDLKPVSALWKILIHILSVLWLLFWLNGGVNEFRFMDFNLYESWFGLSVILFLFVWMINLFNFMDGIDGLAASETIFISCALAFFSWLQNIEYLIFISLTLASSVLGFLILNWPPAKIFMGDVSSGFLGLILGIFIYEYVLEGGEIWSWVILLGVFLVDSGITLLRRILNGERWYEAHCNHAYQHASKIWGHKKVTVAVITINLFWLFPIAVASHLKSNFGAWFTLLAFLPLFVIVLKLNAGVKDVSFDS